MNQLVHWRDAIDFDAELAMLGSGPAPSYRASNGSKNG
jgi:hypothetical protein